MWSKLSKDTKEAIGWLGFISITIIMCASLISLRFEVMLIVIMCLIAAAFAVNFIYLLFVVVAGIFNDLAVAKNKEDHED